MTLTRTRFDRRPMLPAPDLARANVSLHETFAPPFEALDCVEPLPNGGAIWHAGDFVHPFGTLNEALRACGRFVTSTAPIRQG